MIALVRINSSEFRREFPPFGLLYIGYALKKVGFDVEVFHCTPEEMSKVAKRIIKKDPIFVGFSVVIGKQVKWSIEMSKLIKSMSDIKIVWGGPHPTLTIELCLKEKYVDVVIIGEGEKTAGELAKALKNNKDLKYVKGIGYKKGDKIIINECRPLLNMDECKMDWDLVNIKDYLRSNINWGCKRVIGYVTSRGCPFNCGFCWNLIANDRRWRGHKKEMVISEIEWLKDEYDIDGIQIVDDNFFARPKRAFDILKVIDLPCRGDPVVLYFSKSFVRKLVECNVRGMLIGLESGSDRLLKLMNKYITVKNILRAVKFISEAPQISPLYSFILGLPTETWKETQMTIDLILKIHDINPNALFTVGTFMPFPGTPLWDVAIKEGFEPPKRIEGWSKIERWEDKMELTWLSWADESTPRKFKLIRNYSKYLQIGTHLRLPLISWLAHKRLENRNFKFPIDYYLMDWLSRKISLKPDGILTKLLKKGG